MAHRTFEGKTDFDMLTTGFLLFLSVLPRDQEDISALQKSAAHDHKKKNPRVAYLRASGDLLRLWSESPSKECLISKLSNGLVLMSCLVLQNEDVDYRGSAEWRWNFVNDVSNSYSMQKYTPQRDEVEYICDCLITLREENAKRRKMQKGDDSAPILSVTSSEDNGDGDPLSGFFDAEENDDGEVSGGNNAPFYRVKNNYVVRFMSALSSKKTAFATPADYSRFINSRMQDVKTIIEDIETTPDDGWVVNLLGFKIPANEHTSKVIGYGKKPDRYWGNKKHGRYGDRNSMIGILKELWHQYKGVREEADELGWYGSREHKWRHSDHFEEVVNKSHWTINQIGPNNSYVKKEIGYLNRQLDALRGYDRELSHALKPIEDAKRKQELGEMGIFRRLFDQTKTHVTTMAGIAVNKLVDFNLVAGAATCADRVVNWAWPETKGVVAWVQWAYKWIGKPQENIHLWYSYSPYTRGALLGLILTIAVYSHRGDYKRDTKEFLETKYVHRPGSINGKMLSVFLRKFKLTHQHDGEWSEINELRYKELTKGKNRDPWEMHETPEGKQTENRSCFEMLEDLKQQHVTLQQQMARLHKNQDLPGSDPRITKGEDDFVRVPAPPGGWFKKETLENFEANRGNVVTYGSGR